MNRFGPLYAITDPLLLPGERLYQAVAAALAAGVKLVQLRDKTASDEQLTQQARRLVALCNEWNAFCIINDRVDIALASAAHGVHLGQGDSSASRARSLLGDEAIIGVTCHTDISLARRAQEEGASYVAFGRFFSSNTKPRAGAATLDVLQQTAGEIALPVVAIGGIRADNMAPLIQAGAQTLAVCHSLFGCEDTASAAATLMAAYQQCRGAHAPPESSTLSS